MFTLAVLLLYCAVHQVIAVFPPGLIPYRAAYYEFIGEADPIPFDLYINEIQASDCAFLIAEVDPNKVTDAKEHSQEELVQQTYQLFFAVAECGMKRLEPVNKYRWIAPLLPGSARLLLKPTFIDTLWKSMHKKDQISLTNSLELLVLSIFDETIGTPRLKIDIIATFARRIAGTRHYEISSNNLENAITAYFHFIDTALKAQHDSAVVKKLATDWQTLQHEFGSVILSEIDTIYRSVLLNEPLESLSVANEFSKQYGTGKLRLLFAIKPRDYKMYWPKVDEAILKLLSTHQSIISPILDAAIPAQKTINGYIYVQIPSATNNGLVQDPAVITLAADIVEIRLEISCDRNNTVTVNVPLFKISTTSLLDRMTKNPVHLQERLACPAEVKLEFSEQPRNLDSQIASMQF